MSEHKSAAFCPHRPAYNGHLQRAIRKYGWDNFTKEILIEDVPTEDLDNLEISYIKIHNANNQMYGYNMTAGGEGAPDRRRDQYGTVSFNKRAKKWIVISASPESVYIGQYLTKEKAQRALSLYNETGKKLPGDISNRKSGTGSIFKRLSGKYRATIMKNKKIYSKTFNTEKECEHWLQTIIDTYTN